MFIVMALNQMNHDQIDHDQIDHDQVDQTTTIRSDRLDADADESTRDSRPETVDQTNHAQIDQFHGHSVLITGVAGFIGMSTASRMLSLNSSKVVGIDSFNDYYDIELKREREKLLTTKGASVIHGDVCDGELLDDILRDHGVDTVLHLAAQAGVRYSREHPEEYWRNNVNCTTELLGAIARSDHHIRIVYASSSSVYGEHDEVPFKETDLLHPQSVYAQTKVQNEDQFQSASDRHKLHVVGLRFFS